MEYYMKDCHREAAYMIKPKGLIYMFTRPRYICSKCMLFVCWDYLIVKELN